MSFLPQLIANSIISGSLYAIIAIGFAFLYDSVKFFDLAYGGVAVVGSYLFYYFFSELHLPLIFALVLALLASSALAYVLYKSVYEHIRKKKASKLVLLIASLGVFTVLQSLIAIFFTSEFRTFTSASVQEFTLLNASFTIVHLAMLASALIIFTGLMLFRKYTSLGRAIVAVSDDEEVSKIVGINTKRVVGYVFAISGAISALSGILVGFDTGIQPTMGLILMLKGVIAAIIGGFGTLPGALLGGYLLGFVENFGSFAIGGEWKDAIAFVLLILFLIIRPKGIIKRN